MNNWIYNPIEQELIRREWRKREGTVRTIPYISFILTHLALVLFLGALFLVDFLVADSSMRLTVKIVLAVLAVLSLASEWGYAILSSLRWKRDIGVLQKYEEERHHIYEEMRQKEQEATTALTVAQERQRSIILMFERQQRIRQERRPTSFVMSASPIAPQLSPVANTGGIRKFSIDGPKSSDAALSTYGSNSTDTTPSIRITNPSTATPSNHIQQSFQQHQHSGLKKNKLIMNEEWGRQS